MDKNKIRKNGIALLMLMLMASNMTIDGWAKVIRLADAKPQQGKRLLPTKVAQVPNDRVVIEGKLIGSFSILTSDAHISDMTLGHDKTMSHPTDEFGTDDTIFAAVKVTGIEKTIKVKGRLHVVAIEGQKPGPIPGLETIVTLTREGTANFQFSKPTKGWPHGKYKFEALLINESGETIDTESHEFTVD